MPSRCMWSLQPLAFDFLYIVLKMLSTKYMISWSGGSSFGLKNRMNVTGGGGRSFSLRGTRERFLNNSYIVSLLSLCRHKFEVKRKWKKSAFQFLSLYLIGGKNRSFYMYFPFIFPSFSSNQTHQFF